MSITPHPLMLASHIFTAQGRLLQIHTKVPTISSCAPPSERASQGMWPYKGTGLPSPQGKGIPGGRNSSCQGSEQEAEGLAGAAGGRRVRGVQGEEQGGKGCQLQGRTLSEQLGLDVQPGGPLAVSQGPPWAPELAVSPQERGKGVGEAAPMRRHQESTRKDPSFPSPGTASSSSWDSHRLP